MPLSCSMLFLFHIFLKFPYVFPCSLPSPVCAVLLFFFFFLGEEEEGLIFSTPETRGLSWPQCGDMAICFSSVPSAQSLEDLYPSTCLDPSVGKISAPLWPLPLFPRGPHLISLTANVLMAAADAFQLCL